jgi:transposase
MYSKIQLMKGQGFSARKVAKTLKVSRNTVMKYWDMKPDEYAKTYQTVNRLSSLIAYEPVVLKWLETYPCMTAAQVRDWLGERHKVDAQDRTVRRFVAELREKHGITKVTQPKRDYEAVEELPMGYQVQADFGEKKVRHAYSSRYIKLYFAVFTLSYSKYKWGVFQERPFLSTDLVNAMYDCFEYFGGTPSQLVYDQDSIMVVSENSGDIVHTQAFAAFLAETKLEVRVCRRSDPETKGLIEAAVKFVKGNFMENRIYMGIDVWNRSFEEWLIRTGNGQKHGTTKRKPAEMFMEEQEHLKPLYGVAPTALAEDMERAVRKDNTVLYLGNRYSVPLGTYNKDKTIFLAVECDKLHIKTLDGNTLATHKISAAKGKLIKFPGHRRDREGRVAALRDKTIALLGVEFEEYLTILCIKKPRYVKEQLELIVQCCETYGRENVLDSIRYCRELELYSANDLADAVRAFSDKENPSTPSQLPTDDERYRINVQKRSLSAYAEVATKSGVRR